jgi:hypothetical protein
MELAGLSELLLISLSRQLHTPSSSLGFQIVDFRFQIGFQLCSLTIHVCTSLQSAIGKSQTENQQSELKSETAI